TAIRPLGQVLPQSPRIAIETPKLKGSINLKGARIDDIVLPTYKQTLGSDAAIRMFSPAGTKDTYFAGFGWSGAGLKAPDANTLWTAQGSALTPEPPVTLSWDNGEGQRFRIRLSIDQDYMMTVEQTVENRGERAIAARGYG